MSCDGVSTIGSNVPSDIANSNLKQNEESYSNGVNINKLIQTLMKSL
jgi:hypothetical protein